MKMQHKIILAAIGIIIILGPYFIFKKNRSTSEVPQNKIELEAAGDRHVLEQFLAGKKVDERLVYAAVIRLGQISDPEALKVSLQLVSSESKYLREGAAQALAYFEDGSSLESLLKLTKDAAESVRGFAIESLGIVPNQQKIAKLKELDAQIETLSNLEKVEVKSSLFKSYPEKSSEKTEALKELVGLTRTKDSDLFVKATRKAILVASAEDPVKSLMKTVVANPAEIDTKALSIRVLGNLKDPFLNDQYKTLVSDKNPKIRLAALQTLHRACPSDRWNILAKAVAEEKDKEVQRIILEEISFLERGKALEFLNKWSDLAQVPMREQLGQLKAQINQLPEVVNCSK